MINKVKIECECGESVEISHKGNTDSYKLFSSSAEGKFHNKMHPFLPCNYVCLNCGRKVTLTQKLQNNNESNKTLN